MGGCTKEEAVGWVEGLLKCEAFSLFSESFLRVNSVECVRASQTENKS
jgi:hypothetical protein